MNRYPKRIPLSVLLVLLVSGPSATAEDWPMWRYDAARGGASPEELPETLHLQWFLDLPAPQPAWPSEQEKLTFDRLYEPVLLDGRLFVASMLRDRLTAYSAETGEELWRFYADGPMRFAPAAWKDRVFAVADDGFLYCVDAATGALRWKFLGVPSRKLLLGNDRLINAWPARGAPVVIDDTVYFGASIWPFMGIFLHALDAETGHVVWSNTGTGSTFQLQQHDSPAFAGIAPQGYIAATQDRLVVSGGRTMPAVFDRATGKFVHYNVSSRAMGSKGGGGYECTAGNDFYINRGILYRMDNGHFVTSADALIVTKHAIIGKDKEGVHGYRPRLFVEESKDRKGQTVKTTKLKSSWTTPLDEKLDTVYIMSGSRLYATTEKKGEVVALDLPRFDRGSGVSWRVKLPDQPLNMISGHGRLFITSDAGRIYCFGAEPTDAKFPAETGVPLVDRGATWRYLDDGSDQGDEWWAVDFDDGKWKEGAAPLGYGDKPETEVSYGKDSAKKHITTYFRHSFEVDSPRRYIGLDLKVRVDDGAVVYLNGQEVGRLYMPAGAVTSKTLAETGTDEKTYYPVKLGDAALVHGTNVLAVEVHQVAESSSDLLVDLELSARLAKTTPSGPHLGENVHPLLGDVLRELRSKRGYCVALGIGSGQLIEGLVASTELHVVAIDPDAAKVEALRRRLDDLGVYGARVAAIVGDPMEADLPPYMADLVVAEAPAAVGLSTGLAFVNKVFRVLRPYSGVACFESSPSEYARFELAARAAGLDRGEALRSGPLAVLRRNGPPTGSGSWTHQYADAANTVVSSEQNVKLPLGLLWFGGPSHEGILPRHGHGPTPHVVGGRVIIEGRDKLRAVDAYTGRLMWETTLKDVGKYYDYESHEPGANAIGSNYVSLEDGVYVVHGKGCLRLDPASGEIVKELVMPGETADWGYLAISGDVLVGGSQLVDATLPEFAWGAFRSLKDDKLTEALKQIDDLKSFEKLEKEKDERDHEHFRRNVNKLLYSEAFLEHVPDDVRKKAKMEETEKKLTSYMAEEGHLASDIPALELKRALLHKYYAFPEYKKAAAGKFGSYDRMASRRLVAMNRHTGEVLWERRAHYQFRHNAIALGSDKAFAVDRMPSSMISYYQRRGMAIDERAHVVALDLRTGKELWSSDAAVFGTWLSYAEAHDVVLEGGSSARDRSRDEVDKGLIAYSGSTGAIIWASEEKYAGPFLVVDDTIITQGINATGYAVDLMTGEPRVRPHPLSGEPTRWEYDRNYGCNTAIGCPNLLTFRSAAAGYYDLLGDSGTGNLGGFRSGCTSNLIPADGILSAPDYTRSCTCAYQNQASLAFVHEPENEMWTFTAHDHDGNPVQRLGLNFGAPGDRRESDGTFWLDYPSVGGRSPDVPVDVFAKDGAAYPRVFSGLMTDAGELDWIAASAFEGAGEIVVKLVSSGQVEVPNSVEGGAHLAAMNASLSAKIPARTLPQGDVANRTSLGHGGKKDFEGTIDGYARLACKSITVEFWTRVDADVDYVDARGSGRHGFILDNRDLRVRYYVANEKGDDNEPEFEIRSSQRIKDNTWTHVAFTYDAASGHARLYLDGAEVGKNDGPKKRDLWWEVEAPPLTVGKGLSKRSYVDELRIADVALKPESFLRDADGQVDERRVVGYWRMESGREIGGTPRTYDVELLFAELGDCAPGKRVFDVSLQGEVVLRDFDIARDAGGSRCVVVKRFGEVVVPENLRITLTPKSGAKPLLNGVKVVAKSKTF